VVVGRNEQENKEVERLAGQNDVVIRPVEVMGPVALLRSAKVTKKDTEIAARITARYCDAEQGRAVKLDAGGKTMSVKALADEEMQQWRVRPAEKAAPLEADEGEEAGAESEESEAQEAAG
jgi:hypothetical protein